MADKNRQSGDDGFLGGVRRKMAAAVPGIGYTLSVNETAIRG